jgi:hypothetical protein
MPLPGLSFSSRVFVATGISFRPTPVAKTFRINVVIELQNALATIDASSATREPNLYQCLDQVAPIFQHAVPTITVSVAPSDKGFEGGEMTVHNGLNIYLMSHRGAHKLANVIHGASL